jgi:hypothetical protein
MEIGPKTIQMMKALTVEHLDTYAKTLDVAFKKSDDGKLKVSISFVLSVSTEKANSVDVDATISFTAEKIKEKISQTVTENQIELPLTDKVYRMEK